MTLYKFEGNRLLPFSPSKLSAAGHREEDLETWIENNPHILSEERDVAIIGRQYTAHPGVGDLLALDSDGCLLVVELKGKKTPRDTLAQALEYGAWARNLTISDVISIYQDYRQKTPEAPDFLSLVSSLLESESTLSKEDLVGMGIAMGDKHRVVIVAEGISPRIVSVAEYLGEEGLDIECKEVKLYEVGDDKYIETETVYWSRKPAKDSEGNIRRMRLDAPPGVWEILDGVRERLLELPPLIEHSRPSYVGYKVRAGERLSTLIGLYPGQHPDKPGLYVYIHKHPLEKMGKYEDFMEIITRNLGRPASEFMTKSGEFRTDVEETDVDPLTRSIAEILGVSE